MIRAPKARENAYFKNEEENHMKRENGDLCPKTFFAAGLFRSKFLFGVQIMQTL